jgi:dipeptidyl aminopeptidase/acylaminoacyl peptidase
LQKALSYPLILIASTIGAFGQKRPLDFSVPAGWPIIESTALSSDGKYVKYSIRVPNKGTSLFVQTTELSWKKELQGVIDGSFTSDGRRLVFSKSGDSLGICQLGSDSISFIKNASRFTLPKEGDGRFMVYEKTSSQQTLILLDLVNGQEKQYLGAHAYQFDKNGRLLLMGLTVINDSILKDDVFLVDLANDRTTTLCHLCQTSNLTFDEGGSRVAFFTKEQFSGYNQVSLRYYKNGMDSAIVIAGSETLGMHGFQLRDDYLFFSRHSRRIFFWLEESSSSFQKIGMLSNPGADVKIFGSNDAKLEQDIAKGPFLATVNLDEEYNSVTRIQGDSEKGTRNLSWEDNNNWIAIESNVVGQPSWADMKRDFTSRPDIYLVSAVDGSRRLVKKKLIYEDWQFSPSGKFFIWFDMTQRSWFSYNIAHNTTKNISESMRRPVYDGDLEYPGFVSAFNIVGWLKNDNGVLIRDGYDIWQIDLDGVTPPINITHGFGAANKIRFQYVEPHDDRASVFGDRDTLLLSAFDLKSKQDGFFRLIMGSRKLEKLVMSPNIYYQHGNGSLGRIIKAENADKYIISRMSATEYPNWYFTTDFRDFRPVTNLAPQKEYNWYTTDLVHWQLPNGKNAEGVLFKPENFDPRSKYPVIFYYYEKHAFDLNDFIHPELSVGPLPITWFISNGYLVFVPDIHYETGYPGRSVSNTVVSAALYLGKKPWVDVHRLGLQGHSFGGYETNYIVSHSSLFVAAAPASGVCDDINSFNESDISYDYYERTQGRIGATLWQRRDLFIENSPVLSADKVTSNILIMHGANDHTVPYAQGLEWYYALQRLGKKVWLLSYQGEGHTLDQPANRLDYSIRLAQFFGHFLKGEPAPLWMTRGLLPSM